MKDYREEFNNTIGNKYYATNIQVWSLNYILSYIEFLENQLEEKDKVIETVEIWRKEWIDLRDVEECYDNNCECDQCTLIRVYDKYKEKIK